MKLKIFFLSICFIYLTNFFSYAATLEEDIKKYAQNYGNKSANLIVMQEQLQNLKKNVRIQTQIPAIFPLSHQDILKCFADKKIKFEGYGEKTIQELWDLFVKQGNENTRNLSDDAKKILVSIRDLISKVFSNTTSTLKATTYVGKTLENFLKEQGSKNLIVRSTGKEDSNEIANAGGNESVPYVSANLKDVLQAIGIVAASYFSDKSIGQRLALGDKSVFSEKSFFMPVLIQEMIGEPVDNSDKNKIPTSGVVFSQEPYASTKGISLIQATYGNNEAIVAGLAPFDTFFIDEYLNIYPTIRYKSQRLRPEKAGEKIKLGFERNDLPDERPENRIADKQCFPNQIVVAISDISKNAERTYGYPVDIEFVVSRNGGSNVINLVQLRPIVSKNMKPSYAKEEYVSALSSDLKISGEIIVCANNSARILNIDNDNQFLTCNTLAEALSKYLAMSEFDQKKVKGVATKQISTSLSHEATSFRGFGIPVICVYEKFDDVLSWKEAGNTIIMDVQRGMIFKFEGENPQNQILNGWYSHPSPKTLSLFFGNVDKLPKRTFPLKVDAQDAQKTNVMLLNDLRTTPNADRCQKVLSRIINRTQTSLKQVAPRIFDLSKYAQSRKPIEDERLAVLLYEYTQRISQKVLNSVRGDKLYHLYLVKILETLISQTMSPGIIQQHSLGTFLRTSKALKEYAELEQFPTEGANLADYKSAFKIITPNFLNEDVQKKWVNFIDSLNPSNFESQKYNLGQLSQLIYNLKERGILVAWLNTEASQILDSTTDPQQILDKFSDQYNQMNKIIGKISQLYDKVISLNPSIWSSPAEFESQLKHYSNIVLEFTSDKFKSSYDSSGIFQKYVYLDLMQKFVSKFDESIKSLKTGVYTDEAKHVTNFYLAIKLYFDLFEGWASFVADYNEIGLRNLETNIMKYIEVFKKNSFSDSPETIPRNRNHFVPSGKVNNTTHTFAAVTSFEETGIGASKVDTLENPLPNSTLEDQFSLIHQNLLELLGILLTKKLKLQDKIKLPKTLSLFLEKIYDIHKKKFTKRLFSVKNHAEPSLIGIDITDQKIGFLYNKPIQNHCMQIYIWCDLKTHLIHLDLNLFLALKMLPGHSSRPSTISDYIDVASRTELLKNVTLYRPYQYSKQAETFKIYLRIEKQEQESGFVSFEKFYDIFFKFAVVDDFGQDSESFKNIVNVDNELDKAVLYKHVQDYNSKLNVFSTYSPIAVKLNQKLSGSILKRINFVFQNPDLAETIFDQTYSAYCYSDYIEHVFKNLLNNIEGKKEFSMDLYTQVCDMKFDKYKNTTAIYFLLNIIMELKNLIEIKEKKGKHLLLSFLSKADHPNRFQVLEKVQAKVDFFKLEEGNYLDDLIIKAYEDMMMRNFEYNIKEISIEEISFCIKSNQPYYCKKNYNLILKIYQKTLGERISQLLTESIESNDIEKQKRAVVGLGKLASNMIVFRLNIGMIQKLNTIKNNINGSESLPFGANISIYPEPSSYTELINALIEETINQSIDHLHDKKTKIEKNISHLQKQIHKRNEKIKELRSVLGMAAKA